MTFRAMTKRIPEGLVALTTSSSPARLIERPEPRYNSCKTDKTAVQQTPCTSELLLYPPNGIRPACLDENRGNGKADVGELRACRVRCCYLAPLNPTSGEPKLLQRDLQIDEIGSRPLASQPITDLPDNQTRRSLFWEILAMSPSNPDLGYGTASCITTKLPNLNEKAGLEGPA